MNRPTRTLFAALLGGICSMSVATAAHAEGAFAQLYAARPPAGSSFVRLVNPFAAPLRVKIADGPTQRLAGDTVASRYAIVKGNAAFTVWLDGKPAGTLRVAPDTYSTLVPRRDGGGAGFAVIDDAGGAQDALKAELRFYNLAEGCAAGRVEIAPSGPALFQKVAARASAARAVNPVSATLAASCGATASAPLTLPAMQPGDHYSLFLTGAPGRPTLRGQLSETDPYGR